MASFFAGNDIILIAFFFEDEDLDPELDRRDPIDVGGSGLALWGSTDSSLDPSSLSSSLPDSELEDACVFGAPFTFLMAGVFCLVRSSVRLDSVVAIASTLSSNALESSPAPTRRAER